MRDQLPHWIPPTWIDPDQKPRQNQRIRRYGAEPSLYRHSYARTSDDQVHPATELARATAGLGAAAWLAA
jgi:hypothetical protein